MSHSDTLQRYSLYWARSADIPALCRNRSFSLVNVGLLVAQELTKNPPGKHVSLDIDDFLKSSFGEYLKAQSGPKKTILLENLGVLLEPDLDLNPVKLFLELSLDAVVVLIWDNAIIDGTRFVWDEADPGYGFVFPSHTITYMEPNDEVS